MPLDIGSIDYLDKELVELEHTEIILKLKPPEPANPREARLTFIGKRRKEISELKAKKMADEAAFIVKQTRKIRHDYADLQPKLIGDLIPDRGIPCLGCGQVVKAYFWPEHVKARHPIKRDFLDRHKREIDYQAAIEARKPLTEKQIRDFEQVQARKRDEAMQRQGFIRT